MPVCQLFEPANPYAASLDHDYCGNVGEKFLSLLKVMLPLCYCHIICHFHGLHSCKN
jgi:hypothetical protein